jgi:ribosomal protein S12 methylthiotransferase accessory factor
MSPELTDRGGGCDPTAWSCRILTDDGTALAQGMGKGGRDEARVGAMFEAVEHYLTGPGLFDPSAVELTDAARLAAGPLVREPYADLLTRMPGERLACHRYRPLAGGPWMPVPLFAWAPWYVEADGGGLRERAADACDYGELMRYSCNSGCAVGVTADEALLHATCEVIERDALSLLLVRAFLRGTLRPGLIDPATLPAAVARAHAAAERITGAAVHLLDITSDLGVPTMLAYAAPAGGRPHRRGAGTSLSSTHAAWRALTELIQTTLGRARRGDLTGLAGHPALARCGRFDLTGHLRGARTVPFTPAGRLPEPGAQLRRLIATLTARGHRPYGRTVAGLRGGITAVHVIVPGLERFMLITDGNLVVPGPRGRAVI